MLGDNGRSVHPLQVVHLPRRTPDEEEVAYANFFADLVRLHDAREVGRVTARDGDDGTRVDFLYDDNSSPLALEITSIRGGQVAALGSELLKLERGLNETAAAEELGSWILAIQVGSQVRQLQAGLLSFLRRHGGRGDEPVIFDIENAPDDLKVDDLRELAGLLEQGLQSAMRVVGGNGVSIFPPISHVSPDIGFSTWLREAISSNAQKLDETRPRETHLFVALEISVSNDPSKTPPPALPEAVDVLWVYLGYWNAKYEYRMWRTTRVDNPRWQLLDHPLGQLPDWYPAQSPSH